MLTLLAALCLGQYQLDNRSRCQEDSKSIIEYHFISAEPAALDLSRCRARIAGDVSNSAIPEHTRPQHVELQFDGSISESNALKAEKSLSDDPLCVLKGEVAFAAREDGCYVQIVLDHHHGSRPLLGDYTVELTLPHGRNEFRFRDRVKFDREHLRKEEHKGWIYSDCQVWGIEGRDHFLLDSYDHNHTEHAIFVLPHSKVVLEFDYILRGDAKLTIRQDKESVSSWRTLHDEIVHLTATDKPRHFRKSITTFDEATNVCLGFHLKEREEGGDDVLLVTHPRCYQQDSKQRLEREP